MIFTKAQLRYAANAALIILFVVSAVAVYAHGGKQHGAGEFTNLDALKKATELYDKLIGSKKLDTSWEIGIEKVQVFERRKGDETEKVVSFDRGSGDPKTVYIFFTLQGGYAGSNFTGE
jgi:hypothetical protein